MDPSTKESTCICRQGHEDFHCKICSYCSFLSVISLWANNHVRIIQEKNVRDHASFNKEVVFKRLILQYIKPDSRKKVFFSHSIYLPDRIYWCRSVWDQTARTWAPGFLAWWQLTSHALNYNLPYFRLFQSKITRKIGVILCTLWGNKRGLWNSGLKKANLI